MPPLFKVLRHGLPQGKESSHFQENLFSISSLPNSRNLKEPEIHESSVEARPVGRAVERERLRSRTQGWGVSSWQRVTDGGKEGVWVRAVGAGALGPVLGP